MLTDDAVNDLKTLVDLEEMDLTGTKISADGVARLQEGLSQCKIIWEGDSADSH